MSKTYKAVEIKNWGSQDDPASGIAIAEREVPVPGNGEVLVRLFLRPINPSDLFSLAGTFCSGALLFGSPMQWFGSIPSICLLPALHMICCMHGTLCSGRLQECVDMTLHVQGFTRDSNPTNCPPSLALKVRETIGRRPVSLVQCGVWQHDRAILGVHDACLVQVLAASRRAAKEPPNSAKVSA